MLTKDLLLVSYNSGLSISQIAQDNKVSSNKVVYWMNKYGIKRRNHSDASYIKHNPKGDPFRFNIRNKELLALGVALYLAEGSKLNQHGVRFTNSDPKIILIFLKFLKIVCGVKIEVVKAWINYYDDQEYKTVQVYWENITKIPSSNFYKPFKRSKKQGTYKKRSKYGTITLLVDNTKFQALINEYCKKYMNKYADVAQW